MRPRALARQAPGPDAVSLPDVGRMSRQEFRQLEAALYGNQPPNRGSSAASGPSHNARLISELRSMPTNGASSSSTSVASLNARPPRGGVDRRISGPARSGAAPVAPNERTIAQWRPEATPVLQDFQHSRESPGGLDLVPGQIGERDLRQLLDLDGPTRSSPASQVRGPARSLLQASAGIGRQSAGPSLPEPSHSRPSANTASQSSLENQMVYIPEVGGISRQELQQLEAVLNGSSVRDLSDLPDLSGMDPEQLSRIEAALANGVMGSNSSSAHNRTHQLRQGSPAQALRRPESRGSQRQAQQPDSTGSSVSLPQDGAPDARGTVTFLGPAPRSPLEGGVAHAHGEETWRINEEAFSELSISTRQMPSHQECSICCQSIRAGAVALPCAKQSCASYFHVDCIRPWLERNPSCPLCRCALKDLVSPTEKKCRGCGGAAASVDALLAAMGLAELMGRHHAMSWLLRQNGPTEGAENMDFTGTVLAALTMGPAIQDAYGSAGRPAVADPTSLLMEALLQDSLTPADFAADFTPAENARARLEGDDLAQTLGSVEARGGRGGSGGSRSLHQWQTAASLLGLPSDPDAERAEFPERPPVQSREVPSAHPHLSEMGGGIARDSQSELRSNPWLDWQRDASHRGSQRSAPARESMVGEGPLRDLRRGSSSQQTTAALVRASSELAGELTSPAAVRSNASQRRERFAPVPPPGRFFATPSDITQSVLGRTRQSEASLRLPPTTDLVEPSSPASVTRTRHVPAPLGGGWRPPSRGSTPAQGRPSSGTTGLRSASVPQLGRGASSVNRP